MPVASHREVVSTSALSFNGRCLMPQSQTPMMCQSPRTGECKGRVVGTGLEIVCRIFFDSLTLWHLHHY